MTNEDKKIYGSNVGWEQRLDDDAEAKRVADYIQNS
jgi:hypothetical protein